MVSSFIQNLYVKRKPPKPTKEDYGRHAVKRSGQRHSETCSLKDLGEIAYLIQKNKCILVRDEGRRQIYQVVYNGARLYPVYDRQSKIIITFLKEEWVAQGQTSPIRINRNRLLKFYMSDFTNDFSITRPVVYIIGSRDYRKLNLVETYVNALPEDAVVISGGARGVDRYAVQCAKSRGLATAEFPVTDKEWKVFGKSAGIYRNEKMLRSRPGKVIAFWDGQSKGTKHAIDFATKLGYEVEVIR